MFVASIFVDSQQAFDQPIGGNHRTPWILDTDFALDSMMLCNLDAHPHRKSELVGLPKGGCFVVVICSAILDELP